MYTLRGEFIKARKAYLKGMELKTDLSDYYEYGLTLHYFTAGYLEKTQEIYGKVLEKDPLQLILRVYYMLILGSTGDMLSAEEEYKLIKTKFGDWENIRLADAFILLLRLSTKKELSENDIPEGESTNYIRKLMSSSKEERLKIFQSLSSEKNSGYVGGSVGNTIKICFMAHFIGPESAMEVMEKSNSLLGPLTWVPLMKEVRQLPRFKEFMREIGLVDYWKEYGWPDLCRPVGDDDFVCD